MCCLFSRGISMKELRKLTRADVEDLPVGAQVSCASVPGFMVRRQGEKAPVFVFSYRNQDGGQRKITIGRYGAPWTLDMARKRAQELLNEVKVKGRDVAAEKRARREAPTMAELCDEYLTAAAKGEVLKRGGKAKKASTIATDRSRIEAHIKPLLGKEKVQGVTSKDIQKFLREVAAGKTAKREKGEKARVLHNVRGGKGAASRTVGLLGAIFEYAVKEEMRADNPVRGVTRYADNKKKRRLSDEEYAALGDALVALSNEMWPPALAAIKFLAFTGWRSGEAINLRRGDMHQDGRLAIIDTKTDASARPLARVAADILRAQGKGKADELFFPPTRGGGVMSGFRSFFQCAVDKAGLDKSVTPHVLRHSFISVAADMGRPESTIGALVGHKQHSVTGRYTHHADDVLLAAADEVALEIARRMGLVPVTEEGNIIPFPGAEIVA
ncbi:site-specific integrase [Acidocella sp. KAb 2-4]|uniref:tyrosine-type recombinase/integrase n=1 Tax=Acidocella sp. KAb 2-4 TaxID=2885158 RepID=UPI001D0656B3|nr:site-specific integrase [Acidocella sp. KAb 2-4]MCB5944250.1 site-specific integrase [Acidocella sp. KAb 2-4]